MGGREQTTLGRSQEVATRNATYLNHILYRNSFVRAISRCVDTPSRWVDMIPFLLKATINETRFAAEIP